jgi:hypothetical protein
MFKKRTRPLKSSINTGTKRNHDSMNQQKL